MNGDTATRSLLWRCTKTFPSFSASGYASALRQLCGAGTQTLPSIFDRTAIGMSYPRKRTCALQLGMSALGQKRPSANKLRNLFFMGRAANPSTLRQWPCRDWAGVVRSRPPREDAIARPRQGRARAGVQGDLPWNAATTWHYLRPILSRSLGGSYMGTRSAQGTFVANLPL